MLMLMLTKDVHSEKSKRIDIEKLDRNKFIQSLLKVIVND